MKWYEDPVYIEMSGKSAEIQSLWKPTGGDWYLHDYRGSTKTSRKFEKQMWGDDDKTWQKIEILCYRPSESKDVAVSTDGKTSLCVSVADLVREHCIWLPTQAQLQETVGAFTWKLIGDFFDWLYGDVENGWHVNHQHLDFTSMEQLWLAFVMKELYNKIWLDGEWVKK